MNSTQKKLNVNQKFLLESHIGWKVGLSVDVGAEEKLWIKYIWPGSGLQ